MPSAKKPAAAGKRTRKAPPHAARARKPAKRSAASKTTEAKPAAGAAPRSVVETPPAPPRGQRPRKPEGPTITIEQYVSGIACPVRQKRVLRALGLRHPHHRVVRPDNPAVRGMVKAIPHLVRIEEGERGA